MAKKEIKALYKIKYDCKNSKRYETADDNFPIRDVYVKRPWSNHVDEFELTLIVVEQ